MRSSTCVWASLTQATRYTLEFFGLNLTDEITRGVTFNTPLVGSSGAGTASRSAFSLKTHAQYGVTVRAKF